MSRQRDDSKLIFDPFALEGISANLYTRSTSLQTCSFEGLFLKKLSVAFRKILLFLDVAIWSVSLCFRYLITRPFTHPMQYLLRILPALIILGLGYLGWEHFAVYELKERAPSRRAPSSGKRRVIETAVTSLAPIDYQIHILTQGIVQTSVTTPISSSVPGKIIEIHDSFQNGAFFKKGDILASLDTEDFLAQIISAEADLARAEASLAQENARAQQARRNWEDIGFDHEPNDLVLRIPQLKEAEANLKAAQADLTRAHRNLERTHIRAPYDGRVRSLLVGPGQTISVNTTLGEIYSTETAHIRLPLSSRQLNFIDLGQIHKQDRPIPVELKDPLSQQPYRWQAQIVRTEGELDNSSRELFVIAEIQDPFGLKSDQPPLRFNQVVNAQIQGQTLKDVLVIPRDIIHGSSSIITVMDQIAHRRDIDILWATPDAIITRAPELHNVQIASSKLGFVAEGSKVKIIERAPQIENETQTEIKAQADTKLKPPGNLPSRAPHETKASTKIDPKTHLNAEPKANPISKTAPLTPQG